MGPPAARARSSQTGRIRTADVFMRQRPFLGNNDQAAAVQRQRGAIQSAVRGLQVEGRSGKHSRQFSQSVGARLVTQLSPAAIRVQQRHTYSCAAGELIEVAFL